MKTLKTADCDIFRRDDKTVRRNAKRDIRNTHQRVFDAIKKEKKDTAPSDDNHITTCCGHMFEKREGAIDT